MNRLPLEEPELSAKKPNGLSSSDASFFSFAWRCMLVASTLTFFFAHEHHGQRFHWGERKKYTETAWTASSTAIVSKLDKSTLCIFSCCLTSLGDLYNILFECTTSCQKATLQLAFERIQHFASPIDHRFAIGGTMPKTKIRYRPYHEDKTRNVDIS